MGHVYLRMSMGKLWGFFGGGTKAKTRATAVIASMASVKIQAYMYNVCHKMY